MQGSGLRDRVHEVAEAGGEVVGISFDSPQENKAFAQANDFPFRLLSDSDRSVGDMYGAKRPDDHDYAAFPRRITFLIDPNGKIAEAYKVSDIPSHVEEVIADLVSRVSSGS